MKKLLIFSIVFLFGCGAVESVTTVATGQSVEETETENLLCAVARYGSNISVDCVRKDSK